ncbi:MAG: hypothetical protein MJ184_09530 [Treponema sp.]|uniref:hypothetical protein n=1 Tax=Treponema sp. TaxID=166 RepID=UPI00298E74FF|nr:hypothetical protein [Treponema sp.]MCQ2601586.1 hypothetical protein [Treponema sp.]
MKKTKLTITLVILTIFSLMFISCIEEKTTYKNFTFPQSEPSSLQKTETLTLPPAGYTDHGKTETEIQTFSSPDGLCQIKKMPSYYDVYLDYKKGTPSQTAAAYANTIKLAYPDYEKVLEPYLFEIFRSFLGVNAETYTSILPRMTALLSTLPAPYRAEIETFAQTVSAGTTGFLENGKLSYEEAILLQMIPDALRGTACSALGLWGSKTESDKTIMCRNLEWILGSENQLCKIHAVVHMKNKNHSITNITCLGINGILTAINDSGVFAAILDVGSVDKNYEYENKECYTYALRYALENFDTAELVGNYMVQKSGNFTFSHNIALSDKSGAYCAEDAVASLQNDGKGYSILRNNKTPLIPGLVWENPDSLCILNSFATQNNQDFFTGNDSNYVRFVKYNNLVKSQDKFSLAEVKELLTSEVVDQKKVVNIHSKGVFHTVIIDYATKTIHTAFTGSEGVQNKPEFVEIPFPML